MYRVYDNKENTWLREGFYLSPNGDMYIFEKSLFSSKLVLVSEQRYTVQNGIGMNDKNNKPIFEGDICKITVRNVIGVITYIPEHASYYLLDNKNFKYYPLHEKSVGEYAEIIGNVCENGDLLPSN